MANIKYLDDVVGIIKTLQKKITTLELSTTSNNYNGWSFPAETWTYASASSFTVDGDKTTKYPVGTRFRLKQGGSYKYYYCVYSTYSVGVTTVGVDGGDVSDIQNAAITDNYYSYVDYPGDFPDFIRYSNNVQWKGSGSDPSIGNGSIKAQIKMHGKQLEYIVNITIGSTTTLGSGNLYILLPIETVSGLRTIGEAHLYDLSATRHYISQAIVDSAAFTLTTGLYISFEGMTGVSITPTSPFTFATGDHIDIHITYPIGITV